MANARTPMNPGQRAVLDRLESYAERRDADGLTWETALAHLEALEADGVERATARDRIEELLLKGYLYEVDERLRIPPRS